MSDTIKVAYEFPDGKLKEVISEVNKISKLFVENKLENMQANELLELETKLAGYHFYLGAYEAKEATEKARTYAWRKVCQAGHYTLGKQMVGKEIEKKMTDTELKNQAYLAVVREVNEELYSEWKATFLHNMLESIRTFINTIKDIVKDKGYERTITATGN